MDSEPITANRTFTGYEVTFEDRYAFIGGASVESPEAMLAAAVEDEQRAAQAAYRARRLRALATHVAAQQAAEAEQAKAQRNARAAATRAHNRDPYGFKALLGHD